MRNVREIYGQISSTCSPFTSISKFNNVMLYLGQMLTLSLDGLRRVVHERRRIY
jgi:hypothetical protein